MFIFLSRLINTLFGKHLDFRVRLFNILACAGFLISIIFGVTGIFINAGIINLLICTFIAILSALLIRYSLKSGNYQRCYIITIIVIFFIMFPAFFITAGGYKSGMPVFFVFAILFTVFMLDGKKMIFFTTMLMVAYTLLFIFAYFFPEYISNFDAETDMFIDITISFLAVAIALGVTMSLHLKLYIKQQNELEAARKQAEEFAKMNGELFAAMSHEMRTPLAVMSAYAQFAVEQIKENGANDQTLTDLAMISDEAKRLAKMADGTLKVLMSTTEALEATEHEPITVDMGDLVERLAQLMKPVIQRKGLDMTVNISENIGGIRGEAGELTQLLWNVIQNAITFSRSQIVLTVSSDNEEVIIKVEDDGKGITPDLLPHVLDWGVSGKKDGTGVGLSICRDIVQRYNGTITVKSELNTGTCVIITLKTEPEEV